MVYNKIDLCEHLSPGVNRAAESKVKRVRISAQTGEGLQELESVLAESLGQTVVQRSLVLAPHDSRMRAELYRLKAIVSERIDEKKVIPARGGQITQA